VDTTIDRWLVQEQGWAKTHVYKARKKSRKQQLKNKPTHKKRTQQEQKKKAKIFQQLNMDGENIDAQDGEAFGDVIKMLKPPETTRVISQNVNGVPEYPIHSKSRKIVDQVCGKDSDAWLLQELGLCWPKVDKTGQWAERTRKSGVRSNANLQFYSTELDKSEAIQAGGVAVITTNDLTP
jgi:hypothetical protein